MRNFFVKLVLFFSNEEAQSSFPWWAWVLIGFGVCGLGFGLWYFIKSRNSDNSVDAIYNDNKTLSEFASNNGTDIKTLIKRNKVINKKYESLTETDRKKIQKELNNKTLIIGYQSKSNTIQQSPAVFENDHSLSSQLQKMESTLLREIQSERSGIKNSNEINRLESEKRNSDSIIKQLHSDKSSLEATLQSAKNKYGEIQTEIRGLKEKVITVDYLKGYSESVFSYLKYCQQVSLDAYSCFNKISQQNLKQALAVGHLLMKFQNGINSIPVGNWLQIVQDIKDTGATTNRQLTRSFAQVQNDNDKQREFQRLLFSEVLTKYSSNILILAEAFRNLSRFQVSGDFANEAENTFDKHVSELVNKVKPTGLEIKYVSLFSNWESYMGQIESTDSEKSLAYQEVSGLEKGAIAEIVSYGVKTSFEDTKTIIIIA